MSEFWRPTRKHVLTVSEAVRKHVCAYRGSRTCDCKFARNLKNVGIPTESGNGCCELRTAIESLSVLTDREWEMLQRRIQKRNSVRARAKR